MTISNGQVGYLIVDHEETPELLQVTFMKIRSRVIVPWHDQLTNIRDFWTRLKHCIFRTSIGRSASRRRFLTRLPLRNTRRRSLKAAHRSPLNFDKRTTNYNFSTSWEYLRQPLTSRRLTRSTVTCTTPGGWNIWPHRSSSSLIKWSPQGIPGQRGSQDCDVSVFIKTIRLQSSADLDKLEMSSQNWIRWFIVSAQAGRIGQRGRGLLWLRRLWGCRHPCRPNQGEYYSISN